MRQRRRPSLLAPHALGLPPTDDAIPIGAQRGAVSPNPFLAHRRGVDRPVTAQHPVAASARQKCSAFSDPAAQGADVAACRSARTQGRLALRADYGPGAGESRTTERGKGARGGTRQPRRPGVGPGQAPNSNPATASDEWLGRPESQSGGSRAGRGSGTSVGRPRWPRTRRITGGWSMSAIRRIRPPHRAQAIEAETPPHQVRPEITRGACVIERLAGIAVRWAGDDLRPPRRPCSQNPVVEDQVDPRSGRDGRQPLEQLGRVEHEVGGAIRPSSFERELHLALRRQP